MMRLRRSRVATALAACVLAAAGCQPKNEYAPPPPPAVEVARPVERPVTDYMEFTGSTRALATVDLRARVNGYLEEIHFEDGATVEEGQLLFTLEQAPFRTQVDIAEAELQKARAALDLAEGELRRLRALVRRDAGTAQELDIRQAERDGAAAGVAAAAAALEDSQLQLGYSEIHAPIAGRIGEHLVDRGNLVQTEQTLLATIESYDPIYVDFTLSEGDLLDMRRERSQGGSAPLVPEEQPIEMGLGGEEGYPHTGRLDFAELGVDPGTGTLQLRGLFPNADRMILPGLFARVRTAIGSPSPRLLVPERALGTDQQGEYVLVVGEGDKVEYRSVTLGRTVDGMRVVSRGLEGDEWVIVNGVQRARPGSPVVPERTGLPAEAEALAAEAGSPAPASGPAPAPAPGPDAPTSAKAEDGGTGPSAEAPASERIR